MRIARIIFFMILGAGGACADPIRIAGLSWADDRNDQISNIKKAGYECSEYVHSDLRTFSKEDAIRCTKDKNQLIFLAGEILFNCSVFNMCGLSIQEVAQSLVDAGKVGRMEISLEWPNKSLPSWQVACGRGSDGDRLCIYPDLDGIILGAPVGDTFAQLKLLKGTFGNKPSFD